MSTVLQFKPVQPHASLADQVTAALREGIDSGRLTPGTLLPTEAQLGSQFGVSRTVVREAVSRLKSDGLVVTQRGRGAFVAAAGRRARFVIDGAANWDARELIQIVELRLGFEVAAAGFAAERRSASHLEEMRAALATMREAVASGDVGSGVQADIAFHKAICRAADNPHYLSFFEFLSGLLRENIAVSRRRSAVRAQRIGEAQGEHEAIFDAIAAGDRVRASEAAHHHVLMTMERLAASEEENETSGDAAP